MEDVFNKLNGVDCSDKIEKKNGLSYLSWSYAWSELKKLFPNATSTVYENNDGWNYFTDGKTAWVKCGVTVNELEHIEYLPIMDFRNKSIPVGNITSVDVNKAIQRCITKAIARHGLGLYIYAGEDLPEDSGDSENVHDVRKEPTFEIKGLIEQVEDILKKVGDMFNEKQIAYARWCIEHGDKKGLEKVIQSYVDMENN